MLHLDIPSQEQLNRLADTRSDAAVTIYLATTPTTQQVDTARISLKNLAREAINQLEEMGLDKRRRWPVEEQLADFDDDEEFWAHQAHSLAIFVTPDKLRTFRLANEIPDQVHVSDRFHMKPLLRATTFSNDAYVLSLAEGGVKLIEVPASGEAHEVRVPNLPKDAYDALQTTTLNDRAPSRRITGDEGKNVRLRQYVRIVDKALMDVIKSSSRPLIIAAADPLRELFAQASDYPHIAPDAITGSPEEKSDNQLAEEARPILAKLQDAKVAELRDLYGERFGEGRASSDLSQVARAATHGAVDTLLVDIDVTVPGTIDDDGVLFLDEVDDARNYGVIDEIALRVLRNGGRVMAVRAGDLPEGAKDLAAILRWAA